MLAVVLLSLVHAVTSQASLATLTLDPTSGCGQHNIYEGKIWGWGVSDRYSCLWDISAPSGYKIKLSLGWMVSYQTLWFVNAAGQVVFSMSPTNGQAASGDYTFT
jgi:hypothetical protein